MSIHGLFQKICGFPKNIAAAHSNCIGDIMFIRFGELKPKNSAEKYNIHLKFPKNIHNNVK